VGRAYQSETRSTLPTNRCESVKIRKADRYATNPDLTFTVLATFGAVGVGGAGSGAHGHPGEPNKLTKRRMAAANLAATTKHYNYHFFHHSIITIYTIAISQHRPQSPYKSPVSAHGASF